MIVRPLPADFRLARGSHESPADGMCALEAVAWLAGEPHSDRPACVCPVIGAWLRVVNDGLSDDRQILLRFLPQMVGSRARKHEQARAEYLVWRAIRVFAPLTLDVAGFAEAAQHLREFQGSLREAEQAVRAATTPAGGKAIIPVEIADAVASVIHSAVLEINFAAEVARDEGYDDYAALSAVRAAYAAAKAARAASRAYTTLARAPALTAILDTLDGVLSIGETK